MSLKSFYSERVFPRLLNHAMKAPALGPHRASLLDRAEGRVLEIGFGTGTNLPFYPEAVRELAALDANPGMQRYWRRKYHVDAARSIRCFVGRAEAMPFADASFDTVVSTLTLCSVSDVEQTLREIRRVLTPGGLFLFLEHGLAPDETVAFWQRRIESLNRWAADGCHLTREIEALIRSSGLVADEIERFYLLPVPKTHTWFVKGGAMNPRAPHSLASEPATGGK